MSTPDHPRNVSPETINISRPVPDDASRCVASRPNGQRCRVSRLPGLDKCMFHAPRRKQAGDMHPSLSLAALAALDWSKPDSLVHAERGIWEHLLNETIAPHVAKVALLVARSLYLSSGARSASTASDSLTATITNVLKEAPPQLDEG